MTSLLAAFQFLTLIPPLIRRPFQPQELGQSLSFYPLVGAALGGILYGANLGLSQFLPAQPRAALVLTLWVILVGAFHLDGFLDTLDGIFGGFTPSKRLEIMRDERVGAFGLAGGVLLLVLKYSALIHYPTSAPALILIPTLSRWAMVFSVVAFPYARKEGLGSWIKVHAGWLQLAAATATALAVGWVTLQWWGWGGVLLSLVLSWVTAAFLLTRLPGLTGDNYGACNELVELVLLFVFLGVI